MTFDGDEYWVKTEFYGWNPSLTNVVCLVGVVDWFKGYFYIPIDLFGVVVFT